MGFLAREYGHVPWHPRANGDGVVLDGIAGYQPYLGDLHRSLYDDLIVVQALETLALIREDERRYDLVIAADILQHFTTRDAEIFLERCLAVGGEVVLVSTPRW